MNRRAVLAGGGGMILATAVGASLLQGSGGASVGAGVDSPGARALPVLDSTAPTLTAKPAMAQVAATPATLATPAAPRTGRPVADALSAGYALVVSPRLPLAGIGPDDPDRLLGGEITNWRALGCGTDVSVERLAMTDATISSLGIATIFSSYDELANELWLRPGAVALVPLAAVDVRVKTLSIGGRDPLTSGDQVAPAVRIGVIGDVVPGRNVHVKMAAYGDYTRPFQHVAPMLKAFDLTVANLEGNLSRTILQPPDPHSFSFVSDPAMLGGFANAGIDAVTLANNHTVWNSENWGVQGLLDTISALDEAGLPYFGAGENLSRARQPLLLKAGDETIAWLGMDGVTANYDIPPGVENGVVDYDAGATDDRPGTNPFVGVNLTTDIQNALGQASMVIPYLHMGAEYIEIPPEWVVNAAREAINTGAAMVVTNHPHVIQGMEIYNGCPIIYSPGNFIIDQMWAVEVRCGYALEALARDGRIIGIRMRGTEIEDFHQPRRMAAGEQANLMNRFWRSTDRLAAVPRE